MRGSSPMIHLFGRAPHSNKFVRSLKLEWLLKEQLNRGNTLDPERVLTNDLFPSTSLSPCAIFQFPQLQIEYSAPTTLTNSFKTSSSTVDSLREVSNEKLNEMISSWPKKMGLRRMHAFGCATDEFKKNVGFFFTPYNMIHLMNLKKMWSRS